MDKEPFINDVTAKAPEEVKPYIRFTVEMVNSFIFHERVGYYSYNIPEVIQVAECLRRYRAEVEDGKQTESKPTSREYLSKEYLVDLIIPWVQDIRQTLFHSKSAPFSRIEDAEIWWDKAEKGIDEWHKRVDEWHKRVDEHLSRMKEWDALWQAMEERYPLIGEGIKTWAELKRQGISIDLPKHEEFLPLNEKRRAIQDMEVGEPPEQDEQVKVYGALLDKIVEVVKATGFTVASVKMYILANASPVLPPLSYGIIDRTHSLPSGASVVNRFARVTIRSDVTFEELRSAYRSIRRELGITRSKSHTTKHLQLYQMIRGRGRIPSRKGTVTFWKSVMGEWNNLHPQDKYKTWKGVKLAYDRIIAQLESRITTKGGTT